MSAGPTYVQVTTEYLESLTDALAALNAENERLVSRVRRLADWIETPMHRRSDPHALLAEAREAVPPEAHRDRWDWENPDGAFIVAAVPPTEDGGA